MSKKFESRRGNSKGLFASVKSLEDTDSLSQTEYDKAYSNDDNTDLQNLEEQFHDQTIFDSQTNDNNPPSPNINFENKHISKIKSQSVNIMAAGKAKQKLIKGSAMLLRNNTKKFDSLKRKKKNPETKINGPKSKTIDFMRPSTQFNSFSHTRERKTVGNDGNDFDSDTQSISNTLKRQQEKTKHLKHHSNSMASLASSLSETLSLYSLNDNEDFDNISEVDLDMKITETDHNKVKKVGKLGNNDVKTLSRQHLLNMSTLQRNKRSRQSKKLHAEKRRSYSKPVQDLLEEGDELSRKRRQSRSFHRTLKEKIAHSKVEQNSMLRKLKMKFWGNNNGSMMNKNKVYEISFDVFKKTDAELLDCMMLIFEELQLYQIFYNDYDLARNLLVAIKDGYNSNPFHNWYHAFSVAHMATVFLLRNDHIQRVIGKRYTLAFLIAALGHDLNHPGNDNSYEIGSQSLIARAYRHESVLENYHITILLNFLKDEDKNVFYLLTVEQQASLKEFMVEVVLATDMTYHKDHVTFLNSIEDANYKKALKLRNDRQKLMNCILHASDISGQCIDLPVAIAWEERISSEFRDQAKKIRERGIISNIPPHMELEALEDPQTRAKHQLNFIDFVLTPMWKEIARVFTAMSPLHFNLTKTVRQHYCILSKEGPEKAEEYDKKFQNVKVFDTDFL